VGKDYPGTLLEFEDWFRTEEACRSYLVKLRWPDGFRCSGCGHSQAWEARRGVLRCRACRADTSVTAGTIFHRSHISLRLWFRAMWWVTNQKSGVSALGLQRTLGLGSYKTAWACLHKLRRAMVRPGRDRLTGKVEVDEAIVGGVEPGGHGRQLGDIKALVVVAAEVQGQGIGRVRLKRILHASEDVLLGFVKGAVTPGAVVITDGWEGYSGLKEAGYTHRPRVVSTSEKTASALLPRVHRVIALLKRWLLGIHQGRVSREQLEHYLDEFTFRFNRRHSQYRGMLFYRLAQQAVAVPHVPFRKLVAVRSSHEGSQAKGGVK
jgi:transposase-like protein